jgi:phosphoribosyl 1,2-cyclic phosphodiesterase
MINFSSFASSSAGNLYRISDGVSSLLLECGLPIKKIREKLNHKLHSIDGVLVSHEHQDHAKAAKDIMAAGIDLYCSAGTAHTLGLYGHRLHIIETLKQFKIGPWIILPFDTEHDANEPLGFLIQNGASKVLFCTDSMYLKYTFKDLTMLCVECNYSKATMQKDLPFPQKARIMKSHMSLDTLLSLLEANDLSRVQAIHLLHLSSDNSNEQMFKDKVQALTGIPVYVAPE